MTDEAALLVLAFSLHVLAFALILNVLAKVRVLANEVRAAVKLFADKPWLADGVVLPADCVPRRFGSHYMDDLILCVKQVGPNENDVPLSQRTR